MEVGEHWNMGPEGCKILKPKGPGHLEKAGSGFEPRRAPVPADLTLTVDLRQECSHTTNWNMYTLCRAGGQSSDNMSLW